MKLRRLRQGDLLDEAGITLVRGGELEPDLVRFPTLTSIKVTAVRRAGLRREPTGRNPRHYPRFR